jgi:hypothetical protein
MTRLLPVMLTRLLPLLALLALAACDTAAPPKPGFPQITFGHLPPIALDVAQIQVEEQYAPPLAAPNVEHLMPVSPAAVAHRWAADRLRPAGASGVARVIVKDASVVAQPLQKTEGVRGMFTRDQEVRYVGNLVVEVDVNTAGGLGTGFATGAATRTITAPENISLNRRDQILFDLTAALAQDLNAALEANIRAHLAPFIR